MKNFLNKYLYLLITISLISIGFSAFTIITYESNTEEIKGDISSEETEENNNIKITFDYNDGNYTPDYTLILDNAKKLNSTEINSIPSPNEEYDTTTHKFNGWYTTKSGYLDNDDGSKFPVK